MSVEVLLALALMIFIIGIILKGGSDIDVTVKRSKTLEARLKEELGAKGNGLGDLANSVKAKLPDETFGLLKRINDERNIVVHQKNYDNLSDRQEYELLCNQVENQLNDLKRANQGLLPPLGCLVLLILAVMVYVSLANMN